MSEIKQTSKFIPLVGIIFILLIIWLSKNNEKKTSEHIVTDTIIYWNGEKLINESP